MKAVQCSYLMDCNNSTLDNSNFFISSQRKFAFALPSVTASKNCALETVFIFTSCDSPLFDENQIVVVRYICIGAVFAFLNIRSNERILHDFKIIFALIFTSSEIEMYRNTPRFPLNTKGSTVSMHFEVSLLLTAPLSEWFGFEYICIGRMHMYHTLNIRV